MVTFSTFFSNSQSFILLLLHLSCFIFFSHHRRRLGGGRADSSVNFIKKKLIAPPKKTLHSFFKRLFSPTQAPPPPPPPSAVTPTPSSSTRLKTHPSPTAHPPEINPCTICGEIFQSQPLLELHHSSAHAISDLVDGENIVRIIFNMGWPQNTPKAPTIHRILKIHNTPKILGRFEEYRECVKSKAAAKLKTLRDERCVADGNELLRFFCTTFTCELDSSICSQQYCSLCGIVRSGFSPKMDGISTLPTSYRAHMAIPEDIEEEFEFMHVKRVLLVCRVIAGRVGCDPCVADKEDSGFDSLLAGQGRGDEEDEELLVYNPRGVLPCFAIVYTM